MANLTVKMLSNFVFIQNIDHDSTDEAWLWLGRQAADVLPEGDADPTAQSVVSAMSGE